MGADDQKNPIAMDSAAPEETPPRRFMHYNGRWIHRLSYPNKRSESQFTLLKHTWTGVHTRSKKNT